MSFLRDLTFDSGKTSDDDKKPLQKADKQMLILEDYCTKLRSCCSYLSRPPFLSSVGETGKFATGEITQRADQCSLWELFSLPIQQRNFKQLSRTTRTTFSLG